ncbi:MAG: CGGC domain-containing protein [Thermodesulfovibrionia bacterium]|nr:CGGC domain-containing protein [Thermodesulfovibrionia bacterium]
MAKIGILTCSNTTQDMSCSSAPCLRDMRERKGAFSRYSKDEPLDLTGIINCANCPTLAGYEKLLNRVRALTEFNVDAIHLTYCIDTLCPFKSKYVSLLEKNFPDIEIVVGTHEARATPEQFREKVRKVLCRPRQIMADITKGRVK